MRSPLPDGGLSHPPTQSAGAEPAKLCHCSLRSDENVERSLGSLAHNSRPPSPLFSVHVWDVAGVVGLTPGRLHR